MGTTFPDQPRSATIQIPAADPVRGKRSLPSQFVDLSGKRLTLTAGEPVRRSTVVSVEYEDSMFLGEVLTCVGTENSWTIEIKVEQVLNGLQSLIALRARLLSDGAPQPFGAPRVGVLN